MPGAASSALTKRPGQLNGSVRRPNQLPWACPGRLRMWLKRSGCQCRKTKRGRRPCVSSRSRASQQKLTRLTATHRRATQNSSIYCTHTATPTSMLRLPSTQCCRTCHAKSRPCMRWIRQLTTGVFLSMSSPPEKSWTCMSFMTTSFPKRQWLYPGARCAK